MRKWSPLISIGLPVFNGEEYLADALTGLLCQTYTNLEIIVSDNASTDATPEICEQFAKEDGRIRYLRNETNLGANSNYNRTFRHARGALFRWCAHDDLSAPTYLERCLEALERNPQAVLAHSDTALIDATGARLLRLAHGELDSDGFVERHPEGRELWDLVVDERSWVRLRGVMTRLVYALPIFGLIRTEAMRRTRLLQSFYGTDKVLLAELALQGPFAYVDDVLFERRCHPRTSTRNQDRAVRQRWSDPRAATSFYPVDMTRGYATAIRNAGLPRVERWRCELVLARKLTEPGKIRLAVLPGPWNVFGWGNGGGPRGEQ